MDKGELASPLFEALAEFLANYIRDAESILSHTLLGQFRCVRLEKKNTEAPDPGNVDQLMTI